MNMISSDGKAFGLYTSAGCEKGILINAREHYGFSITLVSDAYYLESTTVLKRLKEKWKRILYISKNKEYRYFDIWVDEQDVEEFKKFVANIKVTGEED